MPRAATPPAAPPAMAPVLGSERVSERHKKGEARIYLEDPPEETGTDVSETPLAVGRRDVEERREVVEATGALVVGGM